MMTFTSTAAQARCAVPHSGRGDAGASLLSSQTAMWCLNRCFIGIQASADLITAGGLVAAHGLGFFPEYEGSIF